MESTNVWPRMGQNRVGRRRVLRGAGVGAAGLAGAALVGCAGGGTTSSKPGSAPAAAVAPAEAKPRFGGVLTMALAADPPGWNVFTATGSVANINTYAYDKVIGLKTGPGVASDSADVIPVLASALPETPDSQTYIFKIRAGVKFQNVAPLNGRPMTIEDVKYSIEALRAHASYKADYAPITSVTTPDAQTI